MNTVHTPCHLHGRSTPLSPSPNTTQVNANAEAAWAFIVDRRIEAPEKFQAIQTYRATMGLLSDQAAFIKEMSQGELGWGSVGGALNAHRMEMGVVHVGV